MGRIMGATKDSRQVIIGIGNVSRMYHKYQSEDDISSPIVDLLIDPRGYLLAVSEQIGSSRTMSQNALYN